jgi:hypothetical protein
VALLSTVGGFDTGRWIELVEISTTELGIAFYRWWFRQAQPPSLALLSTVSGFDTSRWIELVEISTTELTTA